MPYITLEIDNSTPKPEGYIVVNPCTSVTPDGFAAHNLLRKIIAEQENNLDKQVIKWAATRSPEVPKGLLGIHRTEYQLLIRDDVPKDELQQLLAGLEVDGLWRSLRSRI